MSARQEQKKQEVTALKGKFEQTSFFILAGFRGLTVQQLTALRRSLKEGEATFQVVKNTLIEKTLEQMGKADDYRALLPFLEGPTAIVMGGKDPVSSAKTLVRFQKENEQLILKGGVLENSVLGEKEIAALAKLPSRDVLIGQVVSQIAAPLSGLVNVLQGSIRNLVYVLDAISKKKGVTT